MAIWISAGNEFKSGKNIDPINLFSAWIPGDIHLEVILDIFGGQLMKPDINIALLNAAQEIINRFSPLIDDEYEKSRLSSWGALILISAMKFNDSGSSLKQENADILDWLLKFTNLDEDDISEVRLRSN